MLRCAHPADCASAFARASPYRFAVYALSVCQPRGKTSWRCNVDCCKDFLFQTSFAVPSLTSHRRLLIQALRAFTYAPNFKIKMLAKLQTQQRLPAQRMSSQFYILPKSLQHGSLIRLRAAAAEDTPLTTTISGNTQVSPIKQEARRRRSRRLLDCSGVDNAAQASRSRHTAMIIFMFPPS